MTSNIFNHQDICFEIFHHLSLPAKLQLSQVCLTLLQFFNNYHKIYKQIYIKTLLYKDISQSSIYKCNHYACSYNSLCIFTAKNNQETNLTLINGTNLKITMHTLPYNIDFHRSTPYLDGIIFPATKGINFLSLTSLLIEKQFPDIDSISCSALAFHNNTLLLQHEWHSIFNNSAISCHKNSHHIYIPTSYGNKIIPCNDKFLVFVRGCLLLINPDIEHLIEKVFPIPEEYSEPYILNNLTSDATHIIIYTGDKVAAYFKISLDDMQWQKLEINPLPENYRSISLRLINNYLFILGRYNHKGILAVYSFKDNKTVFSHYLLDDPSDMCFIGNTCFIITMQQNVITFNLKYWF